MASALTTWRRVSIFLGSSAAGLASLAVAAGFAYGVMFRPTGGSSKYGAPPAWEAIAIGLPLGRAVGAVCFAAVGIVLFRFAYKTLTQRR